MKFETNISCIILVDRSLYSNNSKLIFKQQDTIGVC